MSAVRPPAVAGLFYDGDAPRLRRTVELCLREARPPKRPAEAWRALLLPHAGHVYSGPVAGAGVGAVEWPERVILLGPNHRGTGAAAALSPASAWRTPLGDVPVERALSEALENACPDLARDAKAHAEEHALEVILPFLQVVRPDVKLALVSIAEPHLGLCREIGAGLAKVVKDFAAKGQRVALVVSSDLSHYLDRKTNRQRDDRALDALVAGDAGELFDRVLARERITMCGILPAAALLAALREIGPSRATVLAHGDSADASGDESRVVGYASVLWEAA